MNKQEMFTKVWKGLEGQNWQQSLQEGSTDRCRYRGPNGLKCAAGHLIPDEMYSPELEGEHILAVFSDNAMIFGEHVDGPEKSFAYRMQTAHDSFEVVGLRTSRATQFTDMRSAFVALAEMENLAIPGDAT